MAEDSISYPQAQVDKNMYEFTVTEVAEIQKHIAKYPDKMSAVMPALWIAQEKYGWLPNGAMQLVADTLGLSFAHVYGVATFYTMYLKKPMVFNDVRTHLVEVCTCFTCGECGGDQIVAYAKKTLKCDNDGYSADKRFLIREAECLGACDTATCLQLDNEHLIHNVDEARMQKLIDDLRVGKEIEYELVPLIDQTAIG